MLFFISNAPQSCLSFQSISKTHAKASLPVTVFQKHIYPASKIIQMYISLRRAKRRSLWWKVENLKNNRKHTFFLILTDGMDKFRNPLVKWDELIFRTTKLLLRPSDLLILPYAISSHSHLANVSKHCLLIYPDQFLRRNFFNSCDTIKYVSLYEFQIPIPFKSHLLCGNSISCPIKWTT